MTIRTAGGGASNSPAPENTILADAYREGMRQLAAGVCLVTTQLDGRSGGMIATAVTSVSANPATLLVCVNHSASIYEMIEQSGRFCINVLAVDAAELVEQFSSSTRREERFRSGEWKTTRGGLPVSAHALVAFDCEMAHHVDWYSHGVLFGRVTEVVHAMGNRSPLLYMDRQFHHLAAFDTTERRVMP